jgi:hypothetical protein
MKYPLGRGAKKWLQALGPASQPPHAASLFQLPPAPRPRGPLLWVSTAGWYVPGRRSSRAAMAARRQLAPSAGASAGGRQPRPAHTASTAADGVPPLGGSQGAFRGACGASLASCWAGASTAPSSAPTGTTAGAAPRGRAGARVRLAPLAAGRAALSAARPKPLPYRRRFVPPATPSTAPPWVRDPSLAALSWPGAAAPPPAATPSASPGDARSTGTTRCSPSGSAGERNSPRRRAAARSSRSSAATCSGVRWSGSGARQSAGGCCPCAPRPAPRPGAARDRPPPWAQRAKATR